MSRALAAEGGTAVLTTILLLPVLLLSLSAALELGALRLVALRVRAAADLATTVAIGDQDDDALARTGLFQPSPDAEAVARAYFAANLEPLGASLAATAAEIASGSDVRVFPESGAIDPLDGRRYDRPAVRLWASVPVRTPGLGPLLAPVHHVQVRSAAVAR